MEARVTRQVAHVWRAIRNAWYLRALCLARLAPSVAASLSCAASVVAATRPASAESSPSVRALKGPYLTGLSESGVEVRFELDRPAPATVRLVRDVTGEAGAQEAAGQGASSRADERPRVFDDHDAVRMHVIRAVGLGAATPYSYAVRVGEKTIGKGRFRTAPAEDSAAPLTFLVYGDDRTDPTAHAAVVRRLTDSASDFLVNTGDLVEDGGRAEDWQSFFDVEASLLRDRALFVAIGNHELNDDQAGANFARYFGPPHPDGASHPYASVRLSNVRFFFLDAMHDWGHGEQRAWFERELARSDEERGLVWRIVVMHQGPWSSGPHGGSTALAGARVPELLAAHRVDLVLSGHDHIYERGEANGMKYVVSGGGGAPLYRVDRKIAAARKDESTYHVVEFTTSVGAIRLAARRVDGSLIDQCGFAKGGGWDCDPLLAAPAPPGGPPPPLPPSPRPATPGGGGACGCAVLGDGSRARSQGLPLAAALWTCVARARKRRRGGPPR
jgi:acid phosphatase type 7